MARKVKLVDNWKRAHKFASIWWTVAGIVAMIFEILNNTWFSLPQEIQNKIPNASYVSLALFIAIAIARVIQWVKPESNDASE
ncbi:putative holin [Erwinia phage Kuerle]|nr:putative holin [Erwinia phage Kuerle]